MADRGGNPSIGSVFALPRTFRSEEPTEPKYGEVGLSCAYCGGHGIVLRQRGAAFNDAVQAWLRDHACPAHDSRR